MILVGDWAPGETKVGIAQLVNGVVLANLEGPILPCAYEYDTVNKAGPHLFSSTLPETKNQFIFSLANNHIMDYGVTGFETTQVQLGQRNFGWCGAGQDINVARQPAIVNDGSVKLGIIACCEAQFGIARLNSPGVAEFGPWVYAAIRELYQTVDAVIVSIHAAVEDSPWPSPYIRDLYRSYIDAGASVVHGHHAHVPQGYEVYREGVIFYGMGNFAVDPDKWQSHPNGMWSLVAEIDFSVKPLYWQPLTFEIHHRPGSETITVEKSTDEEQENHRRYLEMCNYPLGDSELFTALWQEVALRAYCHYGASYMRFLPHPKTGRRMRAKTSLSILKNAFLNKDIQSSTPTHYDYMLWYHMIACESHRQMLATALGILGGEIEDLRTEETRNLADEMTPWLRQV